MHWLRERQEDSEVGLAPLIDVVLLLLIFFMVTTSFRTDRLALELPEADNSEGASDRALLVVELDAAGQIVFDGEPVSLAGFQTALRARADADSDAAALELRADRATPHGAVVEVLDAARGAAIHDVSLAVERRTP